MLRLCEGGQLLLTELQPVSRANGFSRRTASTESSVSCRSIEHLQTALLRSYPQEKKVQNVSQRMWSVIDDILQKAHLPTSEMLCTTCAFLPCVMRDLNDICGHCSGSTHTDNTAYICAFTVSHPSASQTYKLTCLLQILLCS